MANAVQKITLASSCDIPLNKLALGQSNVRRMKAGVSVEELVDSIARRCLIQSIRVRPVVGSKNRPTGMFEVAAFSEATTDIVAGLLLLAWKRLPNRSTRVYRSRTDDGERIIVRRVSPGWAAKTAATGQISLAPDGPHAALLESQTILERAEGLHLRRVRVLGVNPIALSGFTASMRKRLRACGLLSEIIARQLRFFVPIDASGSAAPGKFFDTYKIERLRAREVA